MEVLGRVTAEYAEIVTPAALQFLAKMARKFESRSCLMEEKTIFQSPRSEIDITYFVGVCYEEATTDCLLCRERGYPLAWTSHKM